MAGTGLRLCHNGGESENKLIQYTLTRFFFFRKLALRLVDEATQFDQILIIATQGKAWNNDRPTDNFQFKLGFVRWNYWMVDSLKGLRL